MHTALTHRFLGGSLGLLDAPNSLPKPQEAVPPSAVRSSWLGFFGQLELECVFRSVMVWALASSDKPVEVKPLQFCPKRSPKRITAPQPCWRAWPACWLKLFPLQILGGAIISFSCSHCSCGLVSPLPIPDIALNVLVGLELWLAALGSVKPCFETFFRCCPLLCGWSGLDDCGLRLGGLSAGDNGSKWWCWNSRSRLKVRRESGCSMRRSSSKKDWQREPERRMKDVGQ